MLQTAKRAGDSAFNKAAPHERYLEAFRWMLLTRVFEEKLTSLYRGGMVSGGVYVGRGQEAVSVAGGLFLERGDIFAPLIRDQAGRFAWGESVLEVARTYLGSRQGPMRGRDGNIHRGRPADGYFAMISHLGVMTSVTTGALLAKRFKGEKNFVGLTTIGEGGTSTGAFHEGMNIAAVEQVPLVVVATNNHYAYSTPNEREFACNDLAAKAQGYGFEGYNVDGTDLDACLEVIGGAIQRARVGRPPQLVVASVLRLSGHGEHDDASYITADIKREHFARDCFKVAEETILKQKLADRATLDAWRAKAVAEVEEAVATARQEAAPQADEEDWCAISDRGLVDRIG
jgi:acetoin:2,6-dichlorophenolindophenol oxidoreductase subunit alpha